MTEEHPHRSYGQLDEYQACGVKYEFHRVKKIPGGSTTPMIRGLAFHQGAARNFQQKMRSRVDISLRDVLDATAQAVDDAFRGQVELQPEEESVGLRTLAGRVKDQATAMQRVYHLRRAPHVQPTMVEQRIVVRPPADVFPADLVGVIDLATEVGAVEDHKTGRAWTQAEVDRSHQLTFYAVMYKARTGAFPREVAVNNLSGRGEYPRFTRIASRRDATDAATLLTTLRAAEKGIQAGVFYPTAPDNYWCSSRWCPYWNLCPFVKSGARRPATRGGG